MGLVAASVVYAVLANGLGLGKSLDFSRVAEAPWFGLPGLRRQCSCSGDGAHLVAENLGHIKAVGAMAGRDLDPLMGRAFIGDGLATMGSGAAGGTGVTTYAENIGVMVATHIYSTAMFLAAALIAIVLGFSPKFGALIRSIPLAVMGVVSIVVFGLIAVAGARIWVQNKVDFGATTSIWSWRPSR